MGKVEILLTKALNLGFLSKEEGAYLYDKAELPQLMFVANEIRKKLKPDNKVTWIIDRNVNITNICSCGCLFCSFHKSKNNPDSYVTTLEEYKKKIDETISLGGNQLLLQGGMNKELGLQFYKDLFSDIKSLYPTFKLHALGPPEVYFLSKKEGLTYREVLEELISSGMDSLPGAGAEILCDRVRELISKNKCTSQEWLDVMKEAHKLNITTSATMMYGHIETSEERIEHLVKLREVQSEKPKDSDGFTAFIPWPFQQNGTVLAKKYDIPNFTSQDYIRIIAMSRIMLPNIKNIQASWLTVGKETAQICLHAGANDLGSIMIEENVVSSAGANYKINSDEMIKTIEQSGFYPQLRNQAYDYV